MELTILTETTPDYTLVTVAGKMNGSDETVAFKSTIQKILESGTTRIIVNLAGIDWMNSTGIGALIGVYKMVDLANGKFFLAGAKEPVVNSLHYFQINNLLVNYPTTEEAANAIARA